MQKQTYSLSAIRMYGMSQLRAYNKAVAEYLRLKQVYDIVLEPEPLVPLSIQSPTNWAQEFHKIASWTHPQKNKIHFVVLDTGLPRHEDLKPHITDHGKDHTGSTYDDNHGHGCVEPDSLVHTNFCGIERIETLYNRIQTPELTTPDGTILKNVKHLNLFTYGLDKKTGKGVKSQITFLHKTPINGKVIKVKAVGGFETRLTPWHPIYLKNKDGVVINKRADEVEKNDRLIINNGEEVGTLVTDLYRVNYGKYRQCANCGHIPTYYKDRNTRCQCKQCSKSKWDDREYSMFLTEELAYLAGAIVSDGHLNKNPAQYRIEITSAEKDWLENIGGIFAKLGYHNYSIEPTHSAFRIRIDNKELFQFFEALGIPRGSKSLSVTLPEPIGKSPLGVIYSFIAGVIDGDGYIAKGEVKNKIVTASKTLAKQLSVLMNNTAIRTSVFHQGPVEATYGTAEMWQLCFGTLPDGVVERMQLDRKKSLAESQNTKPRLTRRVLETSEEDYNGFFYDFTVEGTNTYLADGVFVSNSHVGGIILSMMEGYDFTISFEKVLNDSGAGYSSWINSGGRHALEYSKKLRSEGYTVIWNNSWGGGNAWAEFDSILKEAEGAGIIVTASIGNGGPGTSSYPGKSPMTIGVGAHDVNGGIAYFSSDNPEFCAGGVQISSCSKNETGYVTMSGTSMSSPMLAGIIGRFYAAGIPANTRDYLKTGITPKEPAERWGSGYPTLDKYELSDSPPTPPPPPTPDPEPDPEPPKKEERTLVTESEATYSLEYYVQDWTKRHKFKVKIRPKILSDEIAPVAIFKLMDAVGRYFRNRGYFFTDPNTDLRDVAYWVTYFFTLIAKRQYGIEGVGIDYMEISEDYKLLVESPGNKPGTQSEGYYVKTYDPINSHETFSA